MFNKNNPLCIGLLSGLSLMPGDKLYFAISHELLAIKGEI